MKQYDMKKLAALTLALLLVFSLAACAADANAQTVSGAANTAAQSGNSTKADNSSTSSSSSSSGGAVVTTVAATAGGAIDASDLFSKRDLKQSAELDEAVSYSVSDGAEISITTAGVYVLSGSAKNATVTVDAGDEDKVQLVLDGLTVSNENFPVIYVKNADKVFVTTAEGSENSLSVTGTFTADGSTNTDAVIFSRDDLVLNGLGTLNISSTDNGIACKDDLKITGGTLNVSAVDACIEANDSIAVAGGTVTVTSSKKDGLHAENEDDDK